MTSFFEQEYRYRFSHDSFIWWQIRRWTVFWS